MAGYAYDGPVAVQEAVPPPALAHLAAPPAMAATAPGAPATEPIKDEPAQAQDEEDGEDGWETASLCEEILDDAEDRIGDSNGGMYSIHDKQGTEVVSNAYQLLHTFRAYSLALP